eukprot:gene16357-20900_t
MNAAIGSGVVSFVKYFLQRGHTWPENACAIAAKSNNAVMLKFTIESGCLVSSYAATVATRKGNGVVWVTKITSAAAK